MPTPHLVPERLHVLPLIKDGNHAFVECGGIFRVVVPDQMIALEWREHPAVGQCATVLFMQPNPKGYLNLLNHRVHTGAGASLLVGALLADTATPLVAVMLGGTVLAVAAHAIGVRARTVPELR